MSTAKCRRVGMLLGVVCVILAVVPQEVQARETIYGFNTGGPLECSGSAPNISCTDTNSWEGWSYEIFDDGRGGFRDDNDDDFKIWWATYRQDRGWVEVANDRTAMGSGGALFVRVTGSEQSGKIYNKADELNYPGRVDEGLTGGLPYLDFITDGRHRPELVSKDRLSFYMWIPPNWAHNHDGDGFTDSNFEFGTYVCSQADDPCYDRPGCSPYSQGEPCDGTEGHFYHEMALGIWGGGGWVHVLIDERPQLRRNGWGAIDEQTNPSQALFGEDYIPSLTRFYIETIYTKVPTPHEIYVDEFAGLSTAEDYLEHDQNGGGSIATPSVGFFPEGDGHWEISWSSGSGAYGTYAVRYAETEFTNANFDSHGQPIEPLFHKASGGDGLVAKLHEGSGYTKYATKFELGDAWEVAGKTIYFAIKDVSSRGQHGAPDLGGETDERNASDTRIYQIAYHVPGAPPAPSGNDAGSGGTGNGTPDAGHTTEQPDAGGSTTNPDLPSDSDDTSPGSGNLPGASGSGENGSGSESTTRDPASLGQAAGVKGGSCSVMSTPTSLSLALFVLVGLFWRRRFLRDG